MNAWRRIVLLVWKVQFYVKTMQPLMFGHYCLLSLGYRVLFQMTLLFCYIFLGNSIFNIPQRYWFFPLLIAHSKWIHFGMLFFTFVLSQNIFIEKTKKKKKHGTINDFLWMKDGHKKCIQLIYPESAIFRHVFSQICHTSSHLIVYMYAVHRDSLTQIYGVCIGQNMLWHDAQL